MNTAICTPTTFQPDNLPSKERVFADGIAYFLHTVMMGRVLDSRYLRLDHEFQWALGEHFDDDSGCLRCHVARPTRHCPCIDAICPRHNWRLITLWHQDRFPL
jgi:hypothetical protein